MNFPRQENIETTLNPVRVAELARVAGHPQGPMRKLKADENDIFNGECGFS
jgi:serine/threonine-protein kinase mTOR